MPTMAASTGAAFLPIASLAERPSSTISTFSCTPAPTPSTASSSRPARRIFERQRLHQQQLRAFELAVFLSGDDGAGDTSENHGEAYPMFQ